jgi:protein O-mannosyl-transferase
VDHGEDLREAAESRTVSYRPASEGFATIDVNNCGEDFSPGTSVRTLAGSKSMTAEPLKLSADRRVPLWASALIVLAAIAIALSPIAAGGFSYWDDEDTIAQNPGFNPPTWESLANRWGRPHMHIYIPLTQTVWHMLAIVSPRPPAGEIGNVIALPFKLTNLGVHAITSVLVLAILRRMVGPRWAAVTGAIAFAIHPVQVETVAWASGLKDLLFGMFSAACVLVYIGGEQNRIRPRGRNVVTALVILVLAGLSKPTAIVVPAMLLVIDLIWLRRPTGQSLARLMPFAVVALVFAALALMFQPGVANGEQVAVYWRPVVAIDTIVFYFRKLALPIDLAYDYGRTAQRVVVNSREQPWRIAVTVLVVVVAGAGAVWARRRIPLAAVGSMLSLIAIAPVLGLTHFDYAHYSTVADHYLYLPMFGVALIIAAVIDQVHKNRRLLFGVVAIVAVAWMTLAFRQSLTWRNARSVTDQTLSVNDQSYASWSNRALAELRAGNLDAAEPYARHAIDIAPQDPQTAFIMANVLQDRGDYRAAAELVRRALRFSPYSAAYHQRLAVLLGKQGEFVEALAELDKTLALDHEYPGADELARQLRAFLRQQTTRSASGPANR